MVIMDVNKLEIITNSLSYTSIQFFKFFFIYIFRVRPVTHHQNLIGMSRHAKAWMYI